MEISKSRSSHVRLKLIMSNRARASTDDAYFTHPFCLAQHAGRKWARQGYLLED